MTKADLEEYRDRLSAKLAQLDNRLRKHDDIAIESDPELIGSGQLAAQRDFAVGNLERDSALLKEVRAAFDRIADGSYGRCLGCGERIGRARLRAVPWAAYCIRCQQAAESEGRPPSRGSTPRLDEAA